jgi:DNA-binding PadR family transcriptional regulator
MARPLGVATTVILAAIRRRVRYGLDIAATTGLLQGTVYTTLRRLERRGLVEGRWEDPVVAEAERRPRRRYYELTPAGETELERSVERLDGLVGDLGLGPAATEGDV